MLLAGCDPDTLQELDLVNNPLKDNRLRKMGVSLTRVDNVIKSNNRKALSVSGPIQVDLGKRAELQLGGKATKSSVTPKITKVTGGQTTTGMDAMLRLFSISVICILQ